MSLPLTLKTLMKSMTMSILFIVIDPMPHTVPGIW